MSERSRQPIIVLCAPEHPEVLREQFGRYEREYDLRLTATAAETADLLTGARADGHPVALVVTESRLPDSEVYPALHGWRTAVPTARRIVAAHWDHFMADADLLRSGLATGKYDAFLLMPRGLRDEEFHHAIT
ncbi:MAG: response regulator, partial [Microbacterium sp.]